ncbi:MAG: hypothetical protein AMJ78_00280 [Omnitrophica WOR_2 bacterium SM23_29]|nr:MAG: hypothetical protein AMJ78_00280 [Omnitrophica WOR_2 bacterium SM23_29]
MNPKGLKKDEYDVVIIGAGIGGLVCGCYLAKAGMKVLIVEQHSSPGGYCTSFKRKGFIFDSAVHYLGSLREKGQLRKIYNELGLNKKVEILRNDPSDMFIFTGNKIRIRNDPEATISEFQENFKKEALNIKKFFDFIYKSDFTELFIKLKNKVFKDILDDYFKDFKLKSILGLLLGNIGLPPSRASALSSAILYREFILDGGYYPKGGIQAFPNALVEQFKEFGGKIILGKKVETIIVKNQTVKGVGVNKDDFIQSRVVVSNGDATQTFLKLIGKKHLPLKFRNKVESLEISPSASIVYLGLNKNYSGVLKDRCSWWLYTTDSFDLEKMYSDLNRKDKPYSNDIVFCTFPCSRDQSLSPPNSECILLIILSKGMNKEFWQNNKYSLAESLIKKVENFIPNLSKSIVIKEVATPLTLNRYTLNKDGASYGWSSIPSQINSNIMPKETFIKNLYLAGHWVTQGMGQGGVSTVAYCGKNVARSITKNMKTN